jgi:hypothetical protein
MPVCEFAVATCHISPWALTDFLHALHGCSWMLVQDGTSLLCKTDIVPKPAPTFVVPPLPVGATLQILATSSTSATLAVVASALVLPADVANEINAWVVNVPPDQLGEAEDLIRDLGMLLGHYCSEGTGREGGRQEPAGMSCAAWEQVRDCTTPACPCN